MNISRYDYDLRNKDRIGLNQFNLDGKKFYINRGEIWYVKLGLNIGFEQNGKTEFKRPVLVIKKLGSIYLVVPLTSKHKDNIFHHELLTHKFGHDSFAILSQLKVLDMRRFIERIGAISYEELLQVRKKLSKLCFSD